MGNKTLGPCSHNALSFTSETLKNNDTCFPKDSTVPELIQQPFLADMRDNDSLKEEHIDLQVKQGCQVKFRTSSLLLV